MLKFKFSLDKVKMTYYSHTKIKRNMNVDFQANFLEELLETHTMTKSYLSDAISTCKHQYTFLEHGNDEGVIWLGIWTNQPRAIGEQERYIQLEWNPNKTSIPAPIRAWLYYEKARYSCVNSCDLAFDFAGIYPRDVRFFTKSQTMTYGNGARYIRPGGGHLAIKIYDKKKERMEKDKGDEMEQTTRIEITLKKPKLADGLPDQEDFDEMGTTEWEYMQGVTRALAEVFIPAEMKTRIDHLEDKYGSYDQAMLYALRCLDHDQLENALGLMGKTAAVKYRAALKEGDVESLNIDELVLADTITKALRREIDDLAEPPDYWAKYKWYPRKETTCDDDDPPPAEWTESTTELMRRAVQAAKEEKRLKRRSKQ